MRDFFGGEPFVNGRMQHRVRIDLTQGFCPFESSSEIPWLTSIVLGAKRVGRNFNNRLSTLMPLASAVVSSGRFTAA
jgi:hypothetical protein